MASGNKILVIIGCVLALIGWVVALAGVGKLNDLCNDAWNHAEGKDSGTHKQCSDPLSYHWWGVWFGFFLTVVIIIMAIMGKCDAWASTLQAFCAACLSVTMIDADQMNSARNALRDSTGWAVYVPGSSSRNNWGGWGSWDHSDYDSAVDAALAGFIIVCISLMLIIIFLGMGGAGMNVNWNIRISTSNKTAPEKVEKGEKVEKTVKTEKTTVTTIKTEEV